jgi:glutathione S-transferase
MIGAMKLYTCGQRDHGGSLPWPITHPCGGAAHALEKAGHKFEIETVPGYRLLPWTRMGDARAEIRELTGQSNVPVLVLDDGDVIVGSSRIAAWAGEHAAAPAAP